MVKHHVKRKGPKPLPASDDEVDLSKFAGSSEDDASGSDNDNNDSSNDNDSDNDNEKGVVTMPSDPTPTEKNLTKKQSDKILRNEQRAITLQAKTDALAKKDEKVKPKLTESEINKARKQKYKAKAHESNVDVEKVDVGFVVEDRPAPNEGDDDDDDDNDDDDDDEEGNKTKKQSTGLSSAMSRILSSSSLKSSKKSGSVVLTKTKTPLMLASQTELNALKKIKTKRAEVRLENLKTMYIPSVSGSLDLDVVSVIENERSLKRIATRGVVALFNAISVHQFSNGNNNGAEGEGEGGKKDSKDKKDKAVVNKRTFVDMMKQTPTANDDKPSTFTAPVSNLKISKTKPKETSSGKSMWLDDDYMQSAKLNDWDKQDGSGSDSDDGSKKKNVNQNPNARKAPSGLKNKAEFARDGVGNLDDAEEYDGKVEKAKKKVILDVQLKKTADLKKNPRAKSKNRK